MTIKPASELGEAVCRKLRIDPQTRVIYQENVHGRVTIWILARSVQHTLAYNTGKTPDFRNAERAEEFMEIGSTSEPVPDWIQEIIEASPNNLHNRQSWRSLEEKALIESEIEYRKATGQWAGLDKGLRPIEPGISMRNRRIR